MLRTARTILFAAVLPVSLTAGCITQVEADHLEEFDPEPHDNVFAAQDVDLLDQLAPDEEEGWLQTELFTADAPFNRVGLRFDAETPPVIQVRVSYDGAETMTDWRSVELMFSEEGAHNAHIDVGEGATHAQLRFQGAVENLLSFLAVDLFEYQPSGLEGVDFGPADPADVEQGLAATGVVVSKSVWGGRADRCSGGHRPNRITVHHTVTPNNDSMSMPARMRQIQDYHMNTRGYCDVGYHFLVGQDGKVYQGRPELKLGAHAGGANTNNAGVSFIGTFTSVTPSTAQLEAGARIIKALSTEYGITLNRTNVKGHRQVGTTSTSCPGDKLYAKLDALIEMARGTSTGGGGGFCSNRTGTYCDGTALVVCRSGSQVSRTACTHGCQGMPAGTPDQCKAPPPSTVGSYDDVGSSHFAHEAVEKLRARGALYGCGTRRFCPNEPISRAALAHILATLDTSAVSLPSSALFTDVARSHGSYTQIQEVATRGIITACAAGRFCPDDGISRAAAAVFFRRARNVTNLTPATPSFSDVSKTHWAYGAIERARQQGWVSGCGEGRFCPTDSLTRAQAAVIAVRAYGL